MSSISGRLRPWHAAVAILILGGLLAFFTAFSWFGQDDEGGMLMALKGFVDGHALYSDVYTQYGPTYFDLFGGVLAISGLPVTTATSRWIVVVLWIGTASAYGWLAWRITRNYVIALTVLAGTIGGLLWPMTSEPMHPIVLTTALIAGVAASLVLYETRPRAALVGTAVFLALLITTKINVGALAIVALTLAAVLHLPSRLPRLLVATLIATLVPLVLLSSNLDLADNQYTLALVVAAALAVVVRVRDDLELDLAGLSLLRWTLTTLGVIVATAIVVSIPLFATGTTLSSMIDVVVIEPTRIPGILVIAPALTTATVLLSTLAVAAAWVWPQAAPSIGVGAPWRDPLRAGIRILAAIAIVVSYPASATLNVFGEPQPLVVPLLLAWMAVRPPGGIDESAARRFMRTSLALLLVFTTLQAYPTAVLPHELAGVGLALLIAALLANDAWSLVGADARQATRGALMPSIAAATGLAVLATVVYVSVLTPLAANAQRYKDGRPVAANGMNLVRLNNQLATAIEGISKTIRDRCGSVVSVPGVNSFYLWSKRQPPTQTNATVWFLLLDRAQQQKIVDSISDDPRLCVVREEWKITYQRDLSKDKTIPELPLWRYLSTTPLEHAGTFDGGETRHWELYVRKGEGK